MLDLERKPVDTDPSVLADCQAVMITLIPALEEDAIVGPIGDVEAEHLGVIRLGQLEVRDGDIDMAETEYSHGLRQYGRRRASRHQHSA